MESVQPEEVLQSPGKYQRIFQEEGFIHLSSVFSVDECQKAVVAIKKFEESLDSSNSVDLVTEDINGNILTKYFQGAYRLGDPLKRFFSSRLLSIGVSLLGEEAYFADLEAHIRNPGGGEIPKHQDNFYFNLKDARGMTCYIALSTHNKDSGGLNYIRGSHSRVIEHSQSLCPGFSSSLEEKSDLELVASRIYSPDYMVGDVSIHHPNNIHFSKPSGLDVERGFALSARIFALGEVRDPVGVERYKRLLEKNRSVYG